MSNITLDDSNAVTPNDRQEVVITNEATGSYTGVFNSIDTNNSTTTPLGISGNFTGDWTEILYFTSVTIVLRSDEASATDGMVFEFSIDGVSVDEQLEYNLSAGSTRRFNFPCNARYFRLNYTNGTTAQSIFRVQTILQDSFPGNPVLRVGDTITDDRSANLVKSVLTGLNNQNEFVNIKADNLNALKTSSVVTDKRGNDVSVSSFSELRVVERTIDLQYKFLYNIATRFFNITEDNGATVTQSNRQALFSTSTNVAGKAELQSKKYVNYRVSESIEFSCTVRFPSLTGTVGSQTWVADSRAFVGMFTDGENGLWIGFQDDSRFSVFYSNNGTTTQIEQGSFSEDQLDGTGATAYTPDFTKLQILRIEYSWHGIGAMNFEILNPSGEWILFHRETFLNVNTIPHTGNPQVPLLALVENEGNNTNLQMILNAMQVSFIGKANIASQAKQYSSIASKTISTESPVYSLRVLSTFNTFTNGIALRIESIGLASDGNKSVQFRFYLDGTLTGASFADRDTGESVVEEDTTASAITGGTLIDAFPLAKVGTLNLVAEDLGLEIQPGQTLTITAQSASSNEVEVALRWRELH